MSTAAPARLRSAAQLIAEALREKIVDRWQPFPWQVPALVDRSPVVLLTGSVGGGKSHLWREMLNNYMLANEGAFGLVVRHTRESMTAGAMLQLARTAGNAAEAAGSMLRYRNGSMVAYVGMKDATQRTKIRSVGMSGDVDIVVMEEGNEFIEADFNELDARLRGKAGDYRQMIVATNPGPPTHWIKVRLIDGGEASVYYSSAKDNPTNPPDYQERLERMTGTEYQRLVLGLWVAAEGAVHDNWDAAVNLVDAEDWPLQPEWRRIGAIDFGQQHPTVAQWWAIDDDGRMILYREIYRTRMAIEDLSADLVGYNAEDRKLGARTAQFMYDHAGGVRLKGVPCRPANKSVEAGLKVVNQRLRKAGDGRPRMVLWRTARVHPADPRQAAAHRPACTAEEFAGYVWDVRQDGWNKDQPLKMNDDGMDAARYAAMAAEQPRHFVMGAGGETLRF